MKKLINYWPALTGFAFTFLIAVLATSWTPAKAQSQERKGGHQVVVLWARQVGFSTNGHYQVNGAAVYCSSSSSGAPTFPNDPNTGDTSGLIQVADAISYLLDAGFTPSPSHNVKATAFNPVLNGEGMVFVRQVH